MRRFAPTRLRSKPTRSFREFRVQAMNYNHPQFRNMTGRLAELFDSEEGERILRLITQLSDSGDGRGSLTEEKPADKPTKIRVGAWEATGDGSFVRTNT